MRVKAEHAIAGVKIPAITPDKFRNRRDGFADEVMFNCAGLHNFEQIANKVANKLGINKEFVFANKVEFRQDRRFKHFDDMQILSFADGKARIIERIRTDNPNQKICFVGDSVSDMNTQGVCDLFVGFGGVVQRELVKKKAQRYITEFSDLLELFEMIK